MRVERIGDQTLYLGDCRDVLPTLGSVDAVVSDVPYGINWRRGKGGSFIPGRKSKRRLSQKPIISDDKPFDPAHMLDFPDVVLFGANHYCHALPPGKWHAWDKLNGWPSHDFNSDVEFIWQKGRPGKSRIFRYLWKGVKQDGEKGRQRFHQSQKPEAVMMWCLGLIPNARTVLDPYCGSGTTLVAATRLGLGGIGIEIDPVHFETACRRVEEAQRQPRDFFIEPPAPAEQIDMFGAAK
jgi:site-specific DNA-methyltransferase (adenine-specific)/modification methylase